MAMIEHIEAIYEYGVFRPLVPLPLADNERVQLIVKSGQQDWLDADGIESPSESRTCL
jgi:predicted DNA-binding antitoxin AbrB/MazE fold protein